jgi:2',3'-cyclic-nucleotide 2'-phosphodiesterase (5'-nucleotidase family)
MLCGGCIRAEKMYEPKKITLRDVLNIFPFEDPCVVLRLTGKQIKDALENGISAVRTFCLLCWYL